MRRDGDALADKRARRLQVTRHLLAGASWATLLWIAVGYVDSSSAVDKWLTAAEAHPAIRGLVIALLLLAAGTVLLLWGASVSYATLDVEPHRVPRTIVIVLMVIGGFAAGLVYYFSFVRRQSIRRT